MSVKLLRRLISIALTLGLAGAAQAACVTASTTMAFQAGSSYDVRATAIPNSSSTAGLNCSGTTLTVLGGSYARATFTSANSWKLSAGGTDSIAYQAALDSGQTKVIAQGGTYDYMNATLLALLGLGSPNNFVAPIFAKIMASPNVEAGTYTDQITVFWDYNICRGVNVALVCIGYETGQKTVTISVSLVVSKDCRIVAPNVVFGTAALASQFGAVTQAALVDCTKNATYMVAFSSGTSPTARPWRTMSNGAGSVLQYNIYRTDGTTIWDESNPLTSTTSGTGSTTATQIQTYVAKVNPAQSSPPAGTYSDNVSVIITF